MAASIWPRGTDCNPPRTISAMYAAVNSVNTTIARVAVDGAQARRDEEAEGHVRQQQQHEQRRTADDLDVDRAHPAHERQARAPPERQQHPEREAQDDRTDGEEQVEQEPAPLVESDGGDDVEVDDEWHGGEHDHQPAGRQQREVGPRPTNPPATRPSTAAMIATPTVSHGPGVPANTSR